MPQQSLIKAFRHAFNGLFRFAGNDRNGRIHFTAAVAVCIAGFYLHISSAEWMMVLLCSALVISLEMGNHALEKLCDAVHPEQSPLIKTAKDVAAGAVLWSAMAAAAIGLLIFVPKLFSL